MVERRCHKILGFIALRNSLEQPHSGVPMMNIKLHRIPRYWNAYEVRWSSRDDLSLRATFCQMRFRRHSCREQHQTEQKKYNYSFIQRKRSLTIIIPSPDIARYYVPDCYSLIVISVTFQLRFKTTVLIFILYSRLFFTLSVFYFSK